VQSLPLDEPGHRPRRGSGGLRALAVTISPLLFVLAVDLPKINPGILHGLAAGCSENCGAIPRANENSEPLAAYYPKPAWPLAESLLQNEVNQFLSFARNCVASGLAVFSEMPVREAYYFSNCNSAADIGNR
jgi:molybdopterin-guanine dinucleotide biosynthesis protein A